MDIQLFPIEEFQSFLVCFARVAGFLAAIPIFFSGQTPPHIKVGLTFLTALLIFPVTANNLPIIQFQTLSFLIFIINELLLGMIIGLIARFIFTSVQYGGRVIGFQMGFAMANVMDPQSGQQTSLIAQFQNVFAILIFLAIDGHHILYRTAVKSFEILPPGNLNLSGQAVPYLFELSGRMFSLGIQFSAPVIAVLLLSGLCLGLIARIFPQGNVFMLSFPLNISISFIVIGLTLNMTYIILRREFDDLANRILTMLQYLM